MQPIHFGPTITSDNKSKKIYISLHSLLFFKSFINYTIVVKKRKQVPSFPDLRTIPEYDENSSQAIHSDLKVKNLIIAELCCISV